MNRALATIALLILSNTFMTLAWYGHIAFKSKIERFGMLSIIPVSYTHLDVYKRQVRYLVKDCLFR